MTDEFAKVGITVHYIENWDLYHRLLGEVHCGTNALRAVPSGTKWWEAGR
jgi:protein-arginine deiminase